MGKMKNDPSAKLLFAKGPLDVSDNYFVTSLVAVRLLVAEVLLRL